MSKGPTANASNVAITTTVPTTVITAIPPKALQDTPVPFVPNVNPPVTFKADFNITPGAGTTALALKCMNEQGTQIGATQTHTVTASVPTNVAATFLDVTGLETGNYTLQITQTGATGGGTVNVINAFAQTDG